MTPTEQDKELDKILYVLIDSVVKARMKWHKQSQHARQEKNINSGFSRYQSELNYADNTAKNAIKKLITADRKRVALEARIETVMSIDAMLRFENIPLHPVQAESLKQYLRQLEAQQEEV